MQRMMRQLRLAGLVVVLTMLAVEADPVPAQESAQALGAQAQRECDLGRRAKERHVRLAHFERSQILAERAIALNEDLADAHFALFCSLGEQLRLDGESLSSLVGFSRVMRELDRTLELNPDHLDALSSKGTFLLRLPAFLGGDKERGERLLKRVLQVSPKAVNARLTLARAYQAQGDHAGALALAKEALKIALAEHREDLIPEAQAALTELNTGPPVAILAGP